MKQGLPSRLNAYIDNHLSAKEIFLLKKELQSDQDAVKLLEELQKSKQILQSLSIEKAPEDFEQKLLMEINKVSQKPVSFFEKIPRFNINWQRLAYNGGLIATAAAIAVLVTVNLNISKNSSSIQIAEKSNQNVETKIKPPPNHIRWIEHKDVRQFPLDEYADKYPNELKQTLVEFEQTYPLRENAENTQLEKVTEPAVHGQIVSND